MTSLDLAYVAAGRLDAFVEINPLIWDTAAGALMVNAKQEDIFQKSMEKNAK